MFYEENQSDAIFDFLVRYVRKLHSDTHIASMLKKNKTMSFLDIIGPSNIEYVIAVVKNGISVWQEEDGAKALFTHGDKKRQKYGQ